MNARVLELLKQPEQFLVDDFKLLEAQIEATPYTQSVRALYLYGIKKHSPQYYEEELSRTAAYTTDKKILYQFINGKLNQPILLHEEEVEEIQQETPTIIEEVKPIEGQLVSSQLEEEETIQEEEIDENQTTENTTSIEETATQTEQKIEGVETEEIIENKKTEVEQELVEETIDTKPTEVEEIQKETETEIEDITETEPAEKVEVEEKIEIEEEVETNQEVSFHEEAPFMENSPVIRPKIHQEKFTPAPQKPNRHEEERKRLLAEVEAKMKAKKKQHSETKSTIMEEAEEENNTLHQEISFAETAHFEVKKEVIEEKEEVTPAQQNTNWQPMSISNRKSNTRFGKHTPSLQNEEPKTAEKTPEVKETITAVHDTKDVKTEKENIPVMNLSFFSPEIKTISQEEEEEEDTEDVLSNKTEEEQRLNQSNIPSFIDTWQSWLKVDRTEELEKEKEFKQISITEISSETKQDIREKAIEKFIQEEPKISKLKEDSDFVIKQNKEDISHLMTETLANIYTEQKLYAQAIKAYKTLIEKHPEKETYFKEKIEEVKSIRSNANNQ